MSKKMITLKSSDGETFEVEEVVALQSLTIKQMIEGGGCANNVISLPYNVKILGKVIEHCRDQIFEGKSSGDLVEDALGAEFMQAVTYLKMEKLLGLERQTLDDLINDKSEEEIREIFGIELDDFTP